MFKLISRLYNKRVSSKGLAVFRILFSLTLFFEILRIYNYKELFYGTLPLLEIQNITNVLLLVWLVVLLFLAFGFLSKLMSIINYLIALYLLNQFEGLIYHMAYTYLGVSFLMILFPLSKVFSIDSLIKSKYGVHTTNEDKKVPVLSYYLILLLGLGFVYLDSIFFKFKTDVWLSGLGLWLPASLPHFTNINDQWFLNQKYLMLFLGYLTIAFELTFPFLFFLKKLRIPLLIIGLGLHFGILFEFPIPYFATGAIAIYMLLVPFRFWNLIPSFYGVKSSPTNKENASIRKFFKLVYTPILSKRQEILGYTFAIVVLCVFQLNSTFNFPVSKSIESRLVAYSEKSIPILNNVKEIKKSVRRFSKHFFGITAHGVFVDGHYVGFDKIYSLSMDGELLPIYTSEGNPQRYLSGGSWVHYNFRVNKPIQRQTLSNLEKGLARYATFWCLEQGLNLDNQEFSVVARRVHYTFNWEKDLLTKNLNEQWREVGTLKIVKGKPLLDLNEPLNNE